MLINYRAMHFRAKLGIAIACHLSVCNVGGLWSHGDWDVRSLQTQTSGVYSKGNTRKLWPKVTHPSWFERRRHSIANFEWPYLRNGSFDPLI